MMVNAVASRIRAGATTDRYNQSEPDWDDTDNLDGLDVWYHQATTSEQLGNRDAVTIEATVTVWDPAADVRSGDRILVVGPPVFDTFEVVGHPRVSSTPRGAHHLEIGLKRVEG